MIKVTVWNEYLEELQYEHVAKVYPNGIHECIREFLEKDPEIQVRCVTLRIPVYHNISAKPIQHHPD